MPDGSLGQENVECLIQEERPRRGGIVIEIDRNSDEIDCTIGEGVIFRIAFYS